MFNKPLTDVGLYTSKELNLVLMGMMASVMMMQFKATQLLPMTPLAHSYMHANEGHAF
jgi:hypothetical protein